VCSGKKTKWDRHNDTTTLAEVDSKVGRAAMPATGGSVSLEKTPTGSMMASDKQKVCIPEEFLSHF
jgi:hypothetical protein